MKPLSRRKETGGARPRRSVADTRISQGELVGSAPTIFVRNLSVQTVIGAFDHERQAPLSLLLDLEIELYGGRAGETDLLSDTIDYGRVIAAIRERLATARYRLLERLAEAVAALILDEFGARKATVSIAKMDLFPGVGPVGVRVERYRTSQRLVQHLEG